MQINGWALSGPRSHRFHAIPVPTDLGDHGPAVCGKRPSAKGGWIEPDQAYRGPRLECRDCAEVAR